MTDAYYVCSPQLILWLWWDNAQRANLSYKASCCIQNSSFTICTVRSVHLLNVCFKKCVGRREDRIPQYSTRHKPSCISYVKKSTPWINSRDWTFSIHEAEGNSSWEWTWSKNCGVLNLPRYLFCQQNIAESYLNYAFLVEAVLLHPQSFFTLLFLSLPSLAFFQVISPVCVVIAPQSSYVFDTRTAANLYFELLLHGTMMVWLFHS